MTDVRRSMSSWTSTTLVDDVRARGEEGDDGLVVAGVDERHLEARRQRVPLEVPGEVDLAPLAEALPEAGQGLVLRDVADLAHLGQGGHVGRQRACLDDERGVRAADVAQVGHDLDLLLDVVERRRRGRPAGARTPRAGGA